MLANLFLAAGPQELPLEYSIFLGVNEKKKDRNKQRKKERNKQRNKETKKHTPRKMAFSKGSVSGPAPKNNFASMLLST